MKNNIYIFYSKYPVLFTIICITLLCIMTKSSITTVECHPHNMKQNPKIFEINTEYSCVKNVHKLVQQIRKEFLIVMNDDYSSYSDITVNEMYLHKQIIQALYSLPEPYSTIYNYQIDISLGMYIDKKTLIEINKQYIALYRITNCNIYLYALTTITSHYVMSNNIIDYELFFKEVINPYFILIDYSPVNDYNTINMSLFRSIIDTVDDYAMPNKSYIRRSGYITL